MNEVALDEFKVYMSKVDKFIADLPRRIGQVKLEIDYLTGECTDIEHYIEFNDLNASNGFKIYKQLQDARRRRREKKDELEYLETIEKRFKHALRHQDGIEQVVKGIDSTQEKLSKRIYTPRVRKDLFNDEQVREVQTRVN